LYHENVVAFRGAVVDAAGVPVAIVTEFCTSGSLEAAIKSDEWLKWKTTKVRIVLGVAKGVEHLHTYKIVHRDLAARNVLLANPKDPVPKVADFGMSRAVDDVEATQLTEKQLGPVRWMAPEQFHRRAYSAYSDVYSFGCVVYEVFMREYPWASIDVVKVAMEVFDGKRPQFSDESKLPSKLLALVQRCWNHEAKNRPTMEEVREQLESIKTHVSRSKSHKKE
jgi:serine/threonine protein kinase